MLRRKARYELIVEQGDTIEFEDIKTQKRLQMNPLEIVNQGLTELFNDEDRATIGHAAARKDSSIVVANNKGSVAVYNYARTLFLPLLFTAYVVSIVINCFMDASSVNFFGSIVPLSFFIGALSFVFEDCVTELYGFTRGIKLICQSFVFLVILSAILFLLVHLSSDKEFLGFFSYYPGDLLASSFAVSIASLIDLFVFSFLFKFFRNYGFWLRSIVSSFIAQFFLSIIGAFIVTYLIPDSATPFKEAFNNGMLLWAFNISFSILYLPLAYAIIGFVKKKGN
ncbi:VUT family protein [Dongshaea marina]|uniref:VUT family protein n=1 Tax=Dongshaea marina TaxID=2047966 RepID=UPI000D3E63B4|nr:VUT family protein [Dongshaea marina]